MSDDKELQSFYSNLHADIIQQSKLQDNEGGPAFLEDTFTNYFIGYLQEYGDLTECEVCYFEKSSSKGNVKVNAYGIDIDEGFLDLIVTIYKHGDTPTKVAKKEFDQAIEQGTRFLRLAIKGQFTDMEYSAPERGMVKMIHEARIQIDRVRIYIITDGLLFDGCIDSEISDAGYRVKYYAWDMRRLYKVVGTGLPYEVIDINFLERFGLLLPCVTVNRGNSDYTAYLTTIPGEILANLYDDYGPRLLELNVRSFLQVKGKVNRGIRETLLKKPTRFFAYNNGISATAESLTLRDTERATGGIESVKGFQVVNGGQTMASIHRAWKKDKIPNLSDVQVQAKITVIERDKIEEIVPEISRYANSQNKVNEADFSANAVFHIEIERLSRKIWVPGEQSRWFYERARGGYQVARSKDGSTDARLKKFDATYPNQQKFTKTELAVYINCWDMLPHIVKLGPEKNFAYFTTRLKDQYDKDWKPDEQYYKALISKAIIFRQTQAMIYKFKLTYPLLAYTYTVAYISYRTAAGVNLQRIWDDQDIPGSLRDTINKWGPTIHDAIVDSAKDKNPTEWAKKKECWAYIQSLDLNIPDKLKSDLIREQPIPSVGFTYGKTSLTDGINIRRVMSYDYDTWVKVLQMGKKEKLLEDWEISIAATLSGYALNDWKTVPSAKQAVQGVKILDLVLPQLTDENGVQE